MMRITENVMIVKMIVNDKIMLMSVMMIGISVTEGDHNGDNGRW